MILTSLMLSQIVSVTVNGPERSWSAKPGEKILLGSSQVRLHVASDYLTITHAGEPRNYGQYTWKNSAPFLILGVQVSVKEGHFPVGYPMNKAKLLEIPGLSGRHVWELMEGQRPLPDERHYPKSGLETYQGLTGGERFVAYFRPWSNLLGSDWPLDEAKAALVLEATGADLSLLRGWPRLDEALRLYSGTGKSYGTNASEGEGLDYLARMWPTSHSGIPNTDGWYRAGDIWWAGGHSNQHYHGSLLPVINAIVNNDPIAYLLGTWAQTHQTSLGLCWSDWTSSNGVKIPLRGMAQYEKANERLGSYYWPSSYKQWALDTEVIAYLTGWPWLIEARDLRRDLWLREDPTAAGVWSRWNGIYGERVGARQLECLRAHWIFDDDAEHRAKYEAWAKALMAAGWKYAEMGQTPWFQNSSYSPTKPRAPWQQCQALHAYWWWMNERRIDRDRLPFFKTMVEQYFEIGTRENPSHPGHWQVFYSIGPDGQNVVSDYGSPSHVAPSIAVGRIAKFLGIDQIHDKSVDDVIRAMELTAAGKVGQISSNLGIPPLTSEELSANGKQFTMSYRGGLNWGYGSAGTKLMNYCVGYSLLRRPKPLIN